MKYNEEYLLSPITFDQIPVYDSWPARLLNLEPFDIKKKTRSEVIREFDTEKWGDLLEEIRGGVIPDIYEIERNYSETFGDFPCMKDNDFFLTNYLTMNAIHLELYEKILAPLVDQGTPLVELGAGYGSKILQLADRGHINAESYVAGELSLNGCNVINHLAKKMGREVITGQFDFFDPTGISIEIPENAVFFTSYSAHYIPEIEFSLIDTIAAFNPKAVIHFEPCYELHDSQSIYGLMCKRYIELNDYNRNLYGLLNQLNGNLLSFTCLQKNILGSNPFLPISVLKWHPT